ncbi:MAG: acyltransferase family protein [Pseudomonadota bacterium]
MDASTAYRKDIDGLRSIAVGLVLLHHAGFEAVSGGFVGVDVFFVISGFLITGIIFGKAEVGRFSFADFFVRRIKRLMPALFLVMLATTLAAFIFLLPADLERFGWSLLWVSLYAGNFFFWQAHGGYFGGNAQEAPLLHTWSLAVEEQYYLLWPIAVVLGLRWLGARWFGALSLLGLVAATLFSEWATQATIGAAYYLLPSRFFQLLLGSVLAIYWSRLPALPELLKHAFSVAGVALIVGSALVLTKGSAFPGFNAVYPSLGCALLILAGQRAADSHGIGVANRFLSLPPFVFFGLISYSLYLWHWPIFAYLRYTDTALTLPVQLGAVAAAIALAYLSWRFVEGPFRHSPSSGLGPVTQRFLGYPGLAVVGVLVLCVTTAGLPGRFDPSIQRMEQAVNTLPHEARTGCHVPFRHRATPPTVDCGLGTLSGERIDGFLFGDSHANHLSGFVDELARDAQLRVVDYTLDQCPPIFDLAWGRSAAIARGCRERNEAARAFIVEHRPTFVFLAASWPAANTTRVYDENGNRLPTPVAVQRTVRTQLTATLDWIEAQGSTPVLFDDVPTVSGINPKCPLKAAAFRPETLSSCVFSELKNTWAINLFDELVKTRVNILRIDPSEALCANQRCKLLFDGVPLYHDDNHLSDAGARRLAREHLDRHGNPLLRSSI